MKLFVNNSGLESDFSGLKDPLAILDSIKNVEYWYKKREINKKNLKDIKKKIRIATKLEDQNKQRNKKTNLNKFFNRRNNAIK